MAILKKINPRKTISLLLFYVAMALSIVYFDLFQAIEDTSKNSPSVENLELVIQGSPYSSSQKFELKVDQFVPKKVIITAQQNDYNFQKRLFHNNRNLAHQFKETERNQLFVNHQSHQLIALIISHQKMEEEELKCFA